MDYHITEPQKTILIWLFTRLVIKIILIWYQMSLNPPRHLSVSRM